MSPVSRYCTYSTYIQAEEGHRGCRRQCQCHDASDGLTSIYCDCVLVLAHYRLCAYSRSDLLGLRGRSVVTGDSCNWNGNCRKSRQLHTIGNSNLSLTRQSETGSSTSRLASSSHPHSSTSDGASSSSSEHSVSVLQSNSGLPIQKPVARRLRRLKSCSVMTGHMLGRLRRAIRVFTRKWRLCRMLRLRMLRVLVLRRL
jgi:hypothetical protein